MNSEYTAHTVKHFQKILGLLKVDAQQMHKREQYILTHSGSLKNVPKFLENNAKKMFPLSSDVNPEKIDAGYRVDDNAKNNRPRRRPTEVQQRQQERQNARDEKREMSLTSNPYEIMM